MNLRWTIAAVLLTAPVGAEEPVGFNRDIRPVLSDRCFACHGPDANTRKAGLRLDLEAEAKLEAIVSGQPDESPLLQRIASDDPNEIMPPPESHKPPLDPAQVELFRRWIAEGAVWAQHWAFETPERPEPPAVSLEEWARNPIDHFILARLEAEGLHPSPEASKEKLLRRLHFDHTGIPPTIQEIDAFLLDNEPGAYERAVDRLLESPHYGERMAVDWLDGARYADTNGFQNDFRREMWIWRDWVIDAFNDNLPYDQFVVEQLAGDLLPSATESQRIATGFVRNNRSNTEGGSIEEEWYVENRVDRVETTATVFMGLTMGCARCHDHKYDPMSQTEFYEMFSFFNSSEDKGFYVETRGNVGPMVYQPTFENQLELARLDKEIEEAEARLAEEKAEAPSDFSAWREQLMAKEVKDLDVQPVVRVPLRGRVAAYSPEGKLDAHYLGDAPVWGEGLLLSSLSLDGTPEAQVQVTEGAGCDREQPFTISAWVKRASGVTSGVISKMDDANAYRGVDLYLADNGIVAVHIVHAWPDNALKVFSQEPVLGTDVWTHVAATYDGSSEASGAKIYINGRRVPTNTEVDTLSGPIDTDEPLRIGSRSNSGHFKGEVADVKIFDRDFGRREMESIIHTALQRAFATEANEARQEAALAFARAENDFRLDMFRRRVEQARNMRAAYQRDEVPSVRVMQEKPEPQPAYVLTRGEYDKPQKDTPIWPDTPDFLPPMPKDAPKNRLGLAQWIVSEDHPLTSRVIANRLWSKFFGRGLVKTQDNFGVQSEPPSHPELLDRLATELIAMEWDLKAFQKLIVTSAAYRQDSSVDPERLERDPENILLARGPRFRMKAELIRDNALAVSGLLAKDIGGPSVKPYQPEGLWEEMAGGASQGPYQRSEGEGLHRRSLYTYRKRTVPHPTLTTFDAPTFETCTVYRARTNTPLQALALLNDTTYVEAARHLAERMMNAAGGDEAARVEYGFRLATGRAPEPKELDILTSGLQRHLKAYEAAPEEAAAYLKHGVTALEEADDPVPLAAYTAIASTLLNLDETITKE